MFTKTNLFLRNVFHASVMLSCLWAMAQDTREFTDTQIADAISSGTALEYRSTNLPSPDRANLEPSGFVSLYLDQSEVPETRFEYSLTFDATPFDRDGNPDTANTSEITLTVEYNVTTGASAAAVDVSKHAVSDAYGYRITGLSSSFTDLNSSAPPVIDGAVPANIGLSIGFGGLSFTTLDTDRPGVNAPQVDDNTLLLSWNPVSGAVSYDVEWTFVDGFGDSFETIKPANEILFSTRDFERNSTRIQTSETNYAIPLLYPRGYLIYRFRAVGRDIQDPNKYRFGRWSAGTGTETTVASWDAAHVWQLTIPQEHRTDLNWQFQASYAEEAKKKEVVSYFDGTLRNRQTVTKINTDDNLIVGEVIYDAQGRPAVEVLPVPAKKQDATSNSIDFLPEFTLNANAVGDPQMYSYQDFDENAQNVLDSPSTTKEMSDSKGAGRYYSANNDSGDPFGDRVPDAEKFPFSQIEYTPDNTGRIRRKGGVGKTHQLGGGHEMEYYYGTAEQKELNRLFGYSVGDAQHYKKNLVIDPNDQVSVSYIDPQGRTIATALMGITPTNLQGLQDESTASGLHRPVQLNLLEGPTDAYKRTTQNFGSRNDALVYASSKLSAFSDDLTFNYSVTNTAPFQIECKDGVFTTYPIIYDFSLRVLGRNGQPLVPSPIVNDDISLANGDVFTVPEFVVRVDRGSYDIAKRLVVDQGSLEAYADEFILRITTVGDACYVAPTEVYQLPSALEDNCFLSCEECENALIADFTDRSGYIAIRNADYDYSAIPQAFRAEEEDRLAISFGKEWDRLLEACRAPCSTTNNLPDASPENAVASSISCATVKSALLNDLKPSGQYGTVLNVLVGDELKSFPQSGLNIFYENGEQQNQLVSTQINGSEAHNSWRNPRHPEFDGPDAGGAPYDQGHYYNTDGTISYITVLEVERPDGSFGFEPPLVGSYDPIPTDDLQGNAFLAEPQYLQNASDFVSSNIWQDQWANSLLPYHPEYCYLQFAEGVCGMVSTSSGAAKNSDSYDLDLRLLSYAAASAAGYMSGSNIIDRDPFFDSQTQNIPADFISEIRFDLRRDLIEEAVLRNYGGSGLSLEAYTYSGMVCDAISECNIGSVNLAGLTAVQQDEYWNRYKANYASLKETIISVFSNLYAKRKGCYNGCIGEEEAPASILNPISVYTELDKTLLQNLLDSAPNADPYCYDQLNGEYAVREKRFQPSDVLYDSGKTNEDLQAELAEYTGYEYFTETGVCPLARDMQLFLENLLQDRELNSFNSTTPTNRAMSAALFEELGGLPPLANTPNMTTVTSGNTLTITFAGLDDPITVSLPNYAPAWGTFSTQRITAFKGANTNGDALFEFAALVKIVTSSGAEEEIVINGTTVARVSGCTIEPNPNAIGPYLGNGEVSGSGNETDCNKRTRFTAAFVNLLNVLNSDGRLASNTDISLDAEPAYTQSYLYEFFGRGDVAGWVVLGGENYALNIDGVDRFILSLDGGNSLDGGFTVARYNSLTVGYNKNDQGLLTDQTFRLSYQDAQVNKGVISGTLSDNQGRLINFLCCGDINGLTGDSDTSNVQCSENPEIEGLFEFHVAEVLSSALDEYVLAGRPVDNIQNEDFPINAEATNAFLNDQGLRVEDRILATENIEQSGYNFNGIPRNEAYLNNSSGRFLVYIGGGFNNNNGFTLSLSFVSSDANIIEAFKSSATEIITLDLTNTDGFGRTANLTYLNNIGEEITIETFVYFETTFSSASDTRSWLTDFCEMSSLELDVDNEVCSNDPALESLMERELKILFNAVFDDYIASGRQKSQYLYLDNSYRDQLLDNQTLRLEDRYIQATDQFEYQKIDRTGASRYLTSINSTNEMTFYSAIHPNSSSGGRDRWFSFGLAFPEEILVDDVLEIRNIDLLNTNVTFGSAEIIYLDINGQELSEIATLYTLVSMDSGRLRQAIGICDLLSINISTAASRDTFSKTKTTNTPVALKVPSVPDELPELCSTDICIPPVPEPQSCTQRYPDYFGAAGSAMGSILTDVDPSEIISEEGFCRGAYQYVIDDYKYYLQTFGITRTDDPNFMGIARFAATDLNLGYPYMRIANPNTGDMAIIDAYYDRITATADVDEQQTWAEFTSEYLSLNTNICVPQPISKDFGELSIEIPEETPCEQFKLSVTEAYTKSYYEDYLALKREEFITSYLDHATNNVEETLTMSYADREYQYTLYYYDQAGNLVQTVPPEGVDRFTEQEMEADGVNTAINDFRAANAATENNNLLPDHELQTEYRYNSLNQLVWQKTPDGGITRFAYDRLGRIIASQNAKQLENNRFSYTAYDYLGRITEAGEFIPNTALSIDDTRGKLRYGADGNFVSNEEEATGNQNRTYTYPLNVSDSQVEVTTTVYSNPVSFAAEIFETVDATNNTADNSRNRVTAIYYYDTRDAATNIQSYDNAMFYNYDIHGNVRELVQHNRLLSIAADNPNSGMKRVLYNYDLISGNVHEVRYQNGAADMFAHRYTYDADNRITMVETSSDGSIWEQDAEYRYYAHGPLARAVLGGKQVQGMDYAYTIQGWLKGVNSEGMSQTADMGGDGVTVAKDAMGYSLNYFKDDYIPIAAATQSAFEYSTAATDDQSIAKNLYNGNIRRMVTSLLDNDETLLAVQQNDYAYDQLNRIKTFQGNSVSGATGPGYFADYSYDRNGNLATLNRKTVNNAGAVVDMDQLTYEYNSELREHPVSKQDEQVKRNNQLVRVRDAVGDTGFGDLADQNNAIATGGVNYEYDAIGQLIEDKAENITNIDWRVDGKVRSVTKNVAGVESNITFQYDGLGNRISKTEVEDQKTTLYVRDAQGNVLAVYTNSSDGSIVPGGDGDNRQEFWQLGTLAVASEEAFEAYDYITVENTIAGNTVEPNGGDLRLTAGNEITLLPNFHAKAGSEFLAEIKDLGSGAAPQEGMFLTEHHIYGSSRLGMEQKNLEITDESAIVGKTFFENKVGDKRYELSNHLGNVLSVITDRKLGTAGDYSPDVVAYNDYYPFGMLMPNRHGNTADYRYGFQGQELDNEIKGEGNSLNYKYRMHDPRVGRFFAVDPLTAKYPHYTPYSFSGNRVIASTELEGLEEKTVIHYLELHDDKAVTIKHTTVDIRKSLAGAKYANTTVILYLDGEIEFATFSEPINGDGITPSAAYDYTQNIPNKIQDDFDFIFNGKIYQEGNTGHWLREYVLGEELPDNPVSRSLQITQRDLEAPDNAKDITDLDYLFIARNAIKSLVKNALRKRDNDILNLAKRRPRQTNTPKEINREIKKIKDGNGRPNLDGNGVQKTIEDRGGVSKKWVGAKEWLADDIPNSQMNGTRVLTKEVEGKTIYGYVVDHDYTKIIEVN